MEKMDKKTIKSLLLALRDNNRNRPLDPFYNYQTGKISKGYLLDLIAQAISSELEKEEKKYPNQRYYHCTCGTFKNLISCPIHTPKQEIKLPEKIAEKYFDMYGNIGDLKNKINEIIDYLEQKGV